MAVHVVRHPLIDHKMTILREKDTSMQKFRTIVGEITLLLTYEATRNIPTVDRVVETPLMPMTGRSVRESEITIMPILRAGLGMLHGMLELIPTARVAFMGMERDETTHEPRTYYRKMPLDISQSTVFVLDPMLATAGSLCGALTLVKQGNPKRIIGLCLIAAPEGRERVEAEHPDCDIYVGAMDERLSENKFILPGLGDAGDRMFGTQ